MIDQAIVLAAGYGSRLKPLTLKTPKPLISINGKTPLQRIIDLLFESRCQKIVINTHHLSDQIEGFVKNHPQHYKIVLSHESQILGSGGGVFNAMELLDKPNDPFFVVNADAYFDCSTENVFYKMSNTWNTSPIKKKGQLLLIPLNHVISAKKPYGDFAIINHDANIMHHQFLEDISKTALYMFGGIQILESHFFAGCQKEAFDIHKLWYRSAANQQLIGCISRIQWGDMGTIADLKIIEDYDRELIKNLLDHRFSNLNRV